MIGIKIFNEFLDIPQGTIMEIERNNPYLGTDEIPAEASLPINFKYTDKNYRLITYVGNFYKINKKMVIDAELYDNGNYRYSGKILIQKYNSGINDITQTVWNAVFTANSSDFFQSVKDVQLHQIDLGGVRSFAWTGGDITDGSGGFWQHIHAARTPNAFDYCFYTVANTSWVDADTRVASDGLVHVPNGNYSDYLNCLDSDRNFRLVDGLTVVNIYSIVPMIYVHYLLEKIFEYSGWTLTGDILTDTGYTNLTMVGTAGINWVKRKKGIGWALTYNDPVEFDLKDFVPEGIDLQKFIIDLKNRFGWKFDFDSINKIATLSSLNSSIDTTAKDWTKYALAGYAADFKEQKNIYSLINNIDSNDSYPIIADTSKTSLLAPVADYDSLPDPATTDDNAVCFAFRENTYYINEYDFDTESYKWNLFSHNIGDYIDPDANKSIDSDISTMPVELTRYLDDDSIGLFPRADHQGNHVNLSTPYVNLGVRFLFYHGLQHDSAGEDYPYASCHSSNYAGADNLTPWSIPYKREFGSVNNGVYNYWYKAWLAHIQNDDVRTFNFLLPLFELAKFVWGDRIRVNDTEYIVQTYKELIPYPGIIECKMLRVF